MALRWQKAGARDQHHRVVRLPERRGRRRHKLEVGELLLHCVADSPLRGVTLALKGIELLRLARHEILQGLDFGGQGLRLLARRAVLPGPLLPRGIELPASALILPLPLRESPFKRIQIRQGALQTLRQSDVRRGESLVRAGGLFLDGKFLAADD